jgi:hypothetical protein
MRTLTAGELIRSGRCVHYLRGVPQAPDTGRGYDRGPRIPTSRPAGTGLWLIASRPDKAAAS